MAAPHRSRVAFLCVTLLVSLWTAPPTALADQKSVALDFTPFGSSHADKGVARPAPADATFGRSHMTIMGVDNAIRHFAGYLPLDEGPIAYAVDALRDWEGKYPNDPWIPRDLFMLQRVYERVHTAQSWTYAKRVGDWLHTDFPSAQATAVSGMELACIERGRCWQPPFIPHP